jgi:hypothetical protein
MRHLPILVVLGLAASLTRPAWSQGCPGPQSEQEPNDTAATASPMVLWPAVFDRFVGIHGTIAAPGDVDWYSLVAPAGSRVWISVDTGVAGPTGRATPWCPSSPPTASP